MKKIKKPEKKIEYFEEHHPEWYFPIKNMTTLILGTYPPHVSKWSYEFYYPNKNNRFWNVLARIAEVDEMLLDVTSPVEAIKFRKKLMIELKVGIHNIGKKIRRREKSSLDQDLEFLEYQNLKEILDKNTHLKNILLTGYSSKVNTLRGFLYYLKKEKIASISLINPRAGDQFQFSYKNRVITCFIVNSPSPASQRAGVTLEILEEQFRKAISKKQ